MAQFEIFAKRLLNLEGGYVKHPSDKGGPTKYGVILSTWKQYGYDKDRDGDIDEDDIKLLEVKDAKMIAKKIFWDYFNADHIKNQSIAELLVDWGYNSGRVTAAKKIQQVLQLPVDGLMGSVTLHSINKANQKQLFDLLKQARKTFIENIVKARPSQQVFYKGWMNRIDDFFFSPPESASV